MKKEMKTQLRKKLKEDKKAYRTLLKNLLLQVSYRILTFEFRVSSSLWKVKFLLGAESAT